MTEHSASIFVFFFLGEYSSLILMSAFMAIFFLGGYHCPNLYSLILNPIEDIYYFFYNLLVGSNYHENLINYTKYDNFNKNVILSLLDNNLYYNSNLITNYYLLDNFEINSKMEYFSNDSRFYQSMSIFIDRIYGSYIFGIKIVTVVFFFIWVRASFPRLRYDQLMSLCWKELLPLVFGYIIFSVAIFSIFDMIPYGTGF
jgi:NADH-ubiquinone oxidoreductase chain 1